MVVPNTRILAANVLDLMDVCPLPGFKIRVCHHQGARIGCDVPEIGIAVDFLGAICTSDGMLSGPLGPKQFPCSRYGVSAVKASDILSLT